MLLVVDVGNTNTVLGLYPPQGDELAAHWRVATDGTRTGDEYAVLLHGLMALDKHEWGAITAVALATVGPAGLLAPASLRRAPRGRPRGGRAVVALRARKLLPPPPGADAAGGRPGHEDRHAHPHRKSA